MLFWGSEPLTQAEIRAGYDLAVEDKEAAIELLSTLQEMKSTPGVEGYRGATKMVLASHWFNPVKKWKYFKEGKKQLDAAIEQAPKNLELRHLRYGIQMNAPGFLNYNRNLEADKKFLTQPNNLKSADADLKNRIQQLLKNS